MPHVVMTALLLATAAGCAGAQDVAERSVREPVIGLPCEGCEAVFDGLPPSIPTAARIAPASEPGAPMRIEGTVFDCRGRPAPGVIVYAYHTDARGEYPRDAARRGSSAYAHGRLRGWARSDAVGRYRFDTIRPASYPDATTPAHVHMHVIEEDCCTYYLDDIEFLDDPRLSAEERAGSATPRGGSGLVQPTRDASGGWLVTRDIHLGRHVPGYECAAGGAP